LKRVEKARMKMIEKARKISKKENKKSFDVENLRLF